MSFLTRASTRLGFSSIPNQPCLCSTIIVSSPTFFTPRSTPFKLLPMEAPKPPPTWASAFHGLGVPWPPWCNTKFIANFLSLAAILRKICPVTMDSTRSPSISVHRPDCTVMSSTIFPTNILLDFTFTPFSTSVLDSQTVLYSPPLPRTKNLSPPEKLAKLMLHASYTNYSVPRTKKSSATSSRTTTSSTFP